MENIQEIEMPDFSSKKPKVSSKEVVEKTSSSKKKVLTEERERLPRTNRTVECAYCSQSKILNPDQYQSYFDYWGSEEKIAKEFMCKDCEISMIANPIKFWYRHGEILQELSRHIKVAFELFNKSSKGNQEFNSMRSMVLFHTKDSGIEESNVEFVARQLNNSLPEFHTLKLHKIPHVGSITIKPYENTKNRIEII
jgi:hypothetical protein